MSLRESDLSKDALGVSLYSSESFIEINSNYKKTQDEVKEPRKYIHNIENIISSKSIKNNVLRENKIEKQFCNKRKSFLLNDIISCGNETKISKQNFDFDSTFKKYLNLMTTSYYSNLIGSLQSPSRKKRRTKVTDVRIYSPKSHNSTALNMSTSQLCGFEEYIHSNYLTDFIQTSTLTPLHLRKAKLMFFYSRYPSSAILKIYFPDVRFNKNNTAQLVKWFSNFREFFYIQMEKYARQAIQEGIRDKMQLVVTKNHTLIKNLNMHYNRNNQIELPENFVTISQLSMREFFEAIKNMKDCQPSWKKPIYKTIARLDDIIPNFFKSVHWLDNMIYDN
ncbi:hypothetical protein A3Q56_00283 [Intoshia linei]|uniref:Prospero domain-containing protein n=1 Tax=Intoshia linei TaxID=1819745 RepID=A0A177BCK3_9BILA|nr:hypothetical protein A3Q56_00283 [Intoshia linei]